MDVGKSAHHGHGLTPAGKKVFDKPMPNSEPKLRAVFDELKATFGTVLVIVDQPASIGALPLTVARDAGCQVAYLPGLAVRRIQGGFTRSAERGVAVRDVTGPFGDRPCGLPLVARQPPSRIRAVRALVLPCRRRVRAVRSCKARA
ncbi:transposase [Streptomyces sp. NPDC029003]|uniref:IS110 family transposase n=1 Tax=Streptomyces sp. NPDC029003 TaxID=3155125 RepID=UPI0033FA33A1